MNKSLIINLHNTMQEIEALEANLFSARETMDGLLVEAGIALLQEKYGLKAGDVFRHGWPTAGFGNDHRIISAKSRNAIQLDYLVVQAVFIKKDGSEGKDTVVELWPGMIVEVVTP